MIDRRGIDIGIKKSVEDSLRCAATHGLHFVDFRLDTSPGVFVAFTPARCEAMRTRAEADAMIIGLHTLSAVDIVEYSPDLAEAADHYLRAYIDIVKAPNAGWVDIHAGYHCTSDVEQRKVAGLERLKRAGSRACLRSGAR